MSQASSSRRPSHGTDTDIAKHQLVRGVASVFDMSNRLADIATGVECLDEESLWWFTSRLNDLVYSLLSVDLVRFVAEDNEHPSDTWDRILDGRLHWTYDDGSSTFVRVHRSSVDAQRAPASYYHGDLLARIGDVLGPIEPGCEVQVVPPPHHRRGPEDMSPLAVDYAMASAQRFECMREGMRQREEQRRKSEPMVSEDADPVISVGDSIADVSAVPVSDSSQAGAS